MLKGSCILMQNMASLWHREDNKYFIAHRCGKRTICNFIDLLIDHAVKFYFQID